MLCLDLCLPFPEGSCPETGLPASGTEKCEHMKMLFACPNQWEAAWKLDYQPVGLRKVSIWRCSGIWSIFSFIGPTKFHATQAVLQLHHTALAFTSVDIVVLQDTPRKIKAFPAPRVYSLKAPYGLETSEKGKQTVLFHVTPTINIPVLARHL